LTASDAQPSGCVTLWQVVVDDPWFGDVAERERPVPLTRFESDERGPAVCEADHQPTLHPPTALPLAVTPGTAAAPS